MYPLASDPLPIRQRSGHLWSNLQPHVCTNVCKQLQGKGETGADLCAAW